MASSVAILTCFSAGRDAAQGHEARLRGAEDSGIGGGEPDRSRASHGDSETSGLSEEHSARRDSCHNGRAGKETV